MYDFDAFIKSLKSIHPKHILEFFEEKSRPKRGGIWRFTNEIKPVDLYCYFGARFGRPNGLQNFFRSDDSDNLIHWEWVFEYEGGLISFQGMNFRTELMWFGISPFAQSEVSNFLAAIKRDFVNYGREMAQLRKDVLEKWVEFVNPYQRIKASVDGLLEDLAGLELPTELSSLPDPFSLVDGNGETALTETLKKYARARGLCFGIRSMIPVMAEAFVNLVLFVLMRPELRSDKRMRDHIIRQPIDIRIKSLHMHCIGFPRAVDYASDVCRAYHTLVNERNDLLHGNVAIEKLRFNEVHFHGKVPVFIQYKGIWERSIGVDLHSVGYSGLHNEVKVVGDLIDYVLTCLDEPIAQQVKRVLEERDLGLNEANGRLGILFPGALVDFRVVTQSESAGIEKSAPTDTGESAPPDQGKGKA
ncbi:hypothetical protein BG58_30660 [Caballeronia jiangsuensis]|nr:hypothetical protein BG58_30660 [Caballeronia jiangsuensis]